MASDALSEVWPQDHMAFTDKAIPDLLKTSHILIYTYTSVCFDAMVQGVPVLFVQSDHRVNLNKLDGAPKVCEQAGTPMDIYQKTKDIVGWSDGDRQNWHQKALAVARDYIAPIDKEKLNCFLA